jgi:photosystem II stability/assembly factor-like uncharacterized protein
MVRPNFAPRTRVLVLFLTLFLLLVVAQASRAPACAQGTCGDGVCDPAESMRGCPQDCGIVLVDEDFEDGEVQDWYYDPAGWEIIAEGANHVWHNTQQAYASTGGTRDIAWFLRVRRVSSDANLYFRTQWSNNYGLRLEATRLVLWTEREGFPQDLASANLAIGTTWHDYRIDAVGHQITVTVDGSVVLPFTDSDEGSLRGGIALEAYAADGARFDDIILYSLNPRCYNGQQDGDETGVDCGGSCPNQDCCANRAWDAGLGEGGVDCGGSCALACQPADRLDRWTQTNGPWLEYIRRIRFDPDDPDTLIVSSNTGSGVIKSTDAGVTWHELSGPPGAGGISPMNVFGLAIDPVDKRRMYAGTANGRVYVTVDGGASWALLWEYTDVDDAIWTLEVHPTDRDRLFAGTGDYTGADGRIYRSIDRGDTWHKVLDVDPANDRDQGFISHIAFDPNDADTLYATTGIGDWCGGGSPGDPNPVGFGVWKSVNGGDTWFPINNGLEDLTVSHLVIDPTNPQVLYAGVGCVDDDLHLPGNVFKSINGGASWTRLDGVSPDAPITRLALHPDDPQKVYALGYGGVFYSADGGASWTRLDEQFKSAVYTFFYELVFAPDDPDTMYVGTYAGGIIKSVDRGANWFEINGLRHQGEVLGNSYGTALDPTDPDTMYATTIGGVFKTADGGESWRFIGRGIMQHEREIGIDPTDPDRLYLGGDSRNLYTSDDGGDTWNRVPLEETSAPRAASGLAQVGGDVQFPVIAVDPHSPNRVLVGLTAAPETPLIRSDDYLQTWHTRTLGFRAATFALAFHPTISGTVYAGVGWRPGDPHLLRSEDGGLTWGDAAPGLNLTTVYQMVQANGLIRAATNGGGVFTRWPGDPAIWESTSTVSEGNALSYVTRLASDGGDPDALLAYDKGDRTVYYQDPAESWHWQPALRLADPADEVYDLVYDAQHPNRAYATTRRSGLWRSIDGGASWSQANTGLPAGLPLRGLTISPSSTLYVGATGAPGRLYYSSDGGDHWSPLNDDLTFSTVHAFAPDPSNPNVAYAGVWGGGTWKTADGGDTWTLLPEAPLSAAWIAVDPRDPQVLYATDRTEPTLWQSKDGGQRWWRRFNAAPEYSRLQALAIDPHQPDTVYVSAFKPGGYGAAGSLFRVTPAGYADVTNGLPRVAISLAISPDQPGLILASTHVYGLYRSTNAGQSWQPVTGGLPRVGFNAMAWEPGGALWGGACSGSFPDYLRPPGLPDGDDQPGLYRSADGGLTWEKRLGGVVGKGFGFASGAIYAAGGDHVYLSTDGGDTWTPQPGGPALGYSAVAAGGSRLYVGTLGGGVHTATINANHTLTWQGSQGPKAEIHAIQLLRLPNALFATAFPGGVFKSTDGGASWSEANFGLPGFTLPDPARNGYYALVANPVNPDNLYLGIYGYGVYRSEDGAATWLPASAGLGNRYVYSLLVTATGNTILAGTNDGVQSLWSSPTGTPGRLNWAPASDAPVGWQAVTGITINPENPGEMTLTAFPAGVFSTPDGGAHWYERGNNLYIGKRRTHGVGFEDGYYQLAQDPVNPRHLFFGTYSGQVYETRDGGHSWTAFDQGLMREGSIYAFEVAADGSRLYVSQKAGGVSRRALDPATPQTRVVAPGGAPCTDGSHVYATVAAALAASNPGDRIVVCPGAYAETVVVDRALRLEAFAGPSRTYLRSVTVTGSNARVAGFLLSALKVQGATGVELLGNVILSATLDTMFVKPSGSGALCTQGQPCALPVALAQAAQDATLYLAGGTYTGGGGAVITVTQSITLYGGWDGTTRTPPVRDPALYPTTLDGEDQRRGVYVGIRGAATLDGLTITHGRSKYSGGGIAADLASTIIRNCQFVENYAPGDGGAIFVNGGSTQILYNRVISNTATWAGGLRVINNIDATVIGNVIRGNTAAVAGGGVDVDCCGGSTPLIARNLIADNDGGNAGGGVLVYETQARLVNNIINDNQATTGAGVWLGGMAAYPATATLVHNTLVAHPSGGEGVWLNPYATAALVNNILTGYSTGITNTAPASSAVTADHNLFWNSSDPIVGAGALMVDPLLDANQHLTPASPARDAGATAGVTTDYDGDPRPIDGYDIGADEFVLRCYLPLLLKND